jgi:iron complex transport system substrate-binding protein
MRRIATILALILLGACAGAAGPATSLTATTAGTELTTTSASAFPVTVEADNGQVTIEERPEAIVSLSPTATEMLFAIGAGPQVVAVDDQSDFPEDSPTTDLSGFTPNLEAILSYQPDLVVLSSEPADAPVSSGLAEAGVPALVLDAAQAIEDVYQQIEVIGEATGNAETADQLNRELRDGIEEILAETGTAGEGVTYYHELDPSLFTATSTTFIGQVYGILGMENIADAADSEGIGYPQLSAEYIVAEDPDMIFLADAEFGESAETLAQRPGWEGMTALEAGAVIALDADIASRWGPRVVDLLRIVAEAVRTHSTSS